MIDNRFYKQKRWLDLRASVLRSAKYIDQLEARSGRVVPADTVHHIFPREKYPEYQWKRWNLIAISRATHERLHNRFGEDLSDIGWSLLLETAINQGIPVSRLILVVGLPGTGKTTYVRQRMKDAVAFDLDHIAAAFRLRQAHEERHEPSRRMADLMGRGFAEAAKQYCGMVYIIRTAPTIEEVIDLSPTTVVHCKTLHNIAFRKDYKKLPAAMQEEMMERLNELKEYCLDNSIEYQEV
jgi:adenylate kinase family enzyme